jgi:apolipoprotein N-acyltransferase
VDPFGRELASADYYDTAGGLDLVATMPVQAVPTLYSRIGDVFAWLAIVALIGITVRAIFCVFRPK